MRAVFIYMPASPLLIFLKIFLDSSVVFNGGQHLYEGSVYLKSNLYLANNNIATDYLNKKKETCFGACLKSNFLDHSQFHSLHVNATAVHKVNKDLTSDMLS